MSRYFPAASKQKDLEWKKLQGYPGVSSFYITHDSFIGPSKPFHTKQVKQKTEPQNSQKATEENVTFTPQGNPEEKEENQNQKTLNSYDLLQPVEEVEVKFKLKRRDSKKSTAVNYKRKDAKADNMNNINTEINEDKCIEFKNKDDLLKEAERIEDIAEIVRMSEAERESETERVNQNKNIAEVKEKRGDLIEMEIKIRKSDEVKNMKYSLPIDKDSSKENISEWESREVSETGGNNENDEVKTHKEEDNDTAEADTKNVDKLNPVSEKIESKMDIIVQIHKGQVSVIERINKQETPIIEGNKALCKDTISSLSIASSLQETEHERENLQESAKGNVIEEEKTFFTDIPGAPIEKDNPIDMATSEKEIIMEETNDLPEANGQELSEEERCQENNVQETNDNGIKENNNSDTRMINKVEEQEADRKEAESETLKDFIPIDFANSEQESNIKETEVDIRVESLKRAIDVKQNGEKKPGEVPRQTETEFHDHAKRQVQVKRHIEDEKVNRQEEAVIETVNGEVSQRERETERKIEPKMQAEAKRYSESEKDRQTEDEKKWLKEEGETDEQNETKRQHKVEMKVEIQRCTKTDVKLQAESQIKEQDEKLIKHAEAERHMERERQIETDTNEEFHSLAESKAQLKIGVQLFEEINKETERPVQETKLEIKIEFKADIPPEAAGNQTEAESQEEMERHVKALTQAKALQQEEALQQSEALLQAEALQQADSLQQAETLQKSEVLQRAEALQQAEALEQAEDLKQADALLQTEDLKQTEALEQEETQIHDGIDMQTEAESHETMFKSEFQSEVVILSEAETRSEAELLSETHIQVEDKIQSSDEMKAESEFQTEAEIQTESYFHSEAEIQPEVEIHSEVEIQSEVEKETDNVTHIKIERQSEEEDKMSETQSHEVTEKKAETKTENERQADADNQSEYASQEYNVRTFEQDIKPEIQEEAELKKKIEQPVDIVDRQNVAGRHEDTEKCPTLERRPEIMSKEENYFRQDQEAKAERQEEAERPNESGKQEEAKRETQVEGQAEDEGQNSTERQDGVGRQFKAETHAHTVKHTVAERHTKAKRQKEVDEQAVGQAGDEIQKEGERQTDYKHPDTEQQSESYRPSKFEIEKESIIKDEADQHAEDRLEIDADIQAETLKIREVDDRRLKQEAEANTTEAEEEVDINSGAEIKAGVKIGSEDGGEADAERQGKAKSQIIEKSEIQEEVVVEADVEKLAHTETQAIVESERQIESERHSESGSLKEAERHSELERQAEIKRQLETESEAEAEAKKQECKKILVEENRKLELQRKFKKEELESEKQVAYEEALALKASSASGDEPPAFFGGRKNDQILQIKKFLRTCGEWSPKTQHVGPDMSGPLEDQLSKVVTEVTPGLHLASFLTLSQHDLSKHCIKTVIVVTKDHNLIPNTEMLHIDMPEDEETLVDTFTAIAAKVANAKEQGDTALICCETSTGLAATLCLPYLLKYQGMTLEAATKLMRERRPNSVLDPRLLSKLDAWQKKLWRQRFGQNLVQIIGTSLPLVMLMGMMFWMVRMFQRKMERQYEEEKKTLEYEYFDILKWP